MTKPRPRKIVFMSLPPYVAGEAHHDTKVVAIDLRDPTSNVIDTYLHECLHLEHPDWNEGKVERLAHAATRKLTQHQAAALLRHIARRGVVWEADE